MRIAVTGSIAMDHLMRFSGQFAESLLSEQLDRVSLSFLVEDLEIRRGGIAPNIASDSLRSGWIHFLWVRLVRTSATTALGWSGTEYRPGRCCVGNQAHRSIHLYDGLGQCADRLVLYRCDGRGAPNRAAADCRTSRGLDLVVISPNDPEAMQRHTDECRSRHFDFVADPSQQMAWMDGSQIKRLIDGATYLFSNDYEDGLITQKTGWSHEEILERVASV